MQIMNTSAHGALADILQQNTARSLAHGFISSALWFTRDEHGRPYDSINFEVSEAQLASVEAAFLKLLDEPEMKEYIGGLSKFPLGGAHTAGTQCFFVAKNIIEYLFLVRSEGFFWKKDVTVKLHDLSKMLKGSSLSSFNLGRHEKGEYE